jgi:hypothetical protein
MKLTKLNYKLEQMQQMLHMAVTAESIMHSQGETQFPHICRPLAEIHKFLNQNSESLSIRAQAD